VSSPDAELHANGVLNGPISVQVGHVHDRSFRGAEHPVNLADVLPVGVNQDASKRRRGSGERHQQATFVASSLHGTVEHSHPRVLFVSEVPFSVPVGEPQSSAD
jgi:hypothetical protein